MSIIEATILAFVVGVLIGLLINYVLNKDYERRIGKLNAEVKHRLPNNYEDAMHNDWRNHWEDLK